MSDQAEAQDNVLESSQQSDSNSDSNSSSSDSSSDSSSSDEESSPGSPLPPVANDDDEDQEHDRIGHDYNNDQEIDEYQEA